jgi:hypothetical protein
MNENILRKYVLTSLVALTLSICAAAQNNSTAAQDSKPADSRAIPAIDGGAGPCTADFIVTDANGAPVYAAKIKVHIAYRFGGFHRLDLELSTDSNGKARFTGLPDRVKRGLYFEASEGDRSGEAFDDPSTNCKAMFTIGLQKKNQ